MKPRDIAIVTLGAILCLTAMAPLSRSQSPRQQKSHDVLDPNLWKDFPDQEAVEAMRRQRDQWRKERDQQIKRMNEQAERDRRRVLDETWRQAIGAAPAQWRIIKPRLETLEGLMSDVYTRIRPQISYSTTETPGRVTNCQWRWARSAEERPDAVQTLTETTCETLLELLSNEQAPIDEIWGQVEVLRDQRKQAAEQVPDAQVELRKVLTLRQEAAATARAWLP